MYPKIVRFLASFFFALLAFKSYAVSSPQINFLSQGEQLLGQTFCFDAQFQNGSSDVGYAPYLRLVLDDSLVFDSANFAQLDVTTNNVGNFDVTNMNSLTDTISEDLVSGPANGSMYLLEVPLSSISQGQDDILIEVCLRVKTQSDGVIPDTLLSNAISLTPGFVFGDSPSGMAGDDTILGAQQIRSYTPALVVYSIDDTEPEGENPPGPTWSWPIKLEANIAANEIAAPIVFPTYTLPPDVRLTGTVSIDGGSGCSAMVTPANPPIDGGQISVSCTSGSGLGSAGNYNASDIDVNFEVYTINTLDDTSCAKLALSNTKESSNTKRK